MKKLQSISSSKAKKLILHCQGFGSQLENSENIIQRLGYVQIDTISVIERAHHHVFFSRNPSYQNVQLDEMLEKREVFEYWSHAAAYLPMADYKYSLFAKSEYSKGKNHWFEKDKKVMRSVLKRIKEEGPLQSKDFDSANKFSHPWGDWKPAKMAMTELFMEGKLMVTRRSGFQKVFDLTERVLPDDLDLKKPTKKEYCKYLINRAIQAQGIVTEKEISYLRKGIQPTLRNTIKDLVSDDEIVKLRIENRQEIYYSTTDTLDTQTSSKSEIHILSPFDNLVIQRDRLRTIFEFDYLIECYVPEKKRKYGYFCLPILYGSKFVGRLDPKADRKTKVFYVKNIWFEPGFIPTEEFKIKFEQKLRQLASFCNCHEVKYQ